uniref:DALR anticodon binding domain-containing protein n=1 Tax=Romanomermis culicivorax TaxID=13658 RepID=A0A915KPF1_ROMCU
MPGWNDWVGPKTIEKQRKKAENKVAKKEARRKERKAKLVRLNEKADESIEKFQVKRVPFPYGNVELFEEELTQPLGKEWNSAISYKTLLEPPIKTKAGHIIEPISRDNLEIKMKKDDSDELPFQKEQRRNKKKKINKKEDGYIKEMNEGAMSLDKLKGHLEEFIERKRSSGQKIVVVPILDRFSKTKNDNFTIFRCSIVIKFLSKVLDHMGYNCLIPKLKNNTCLEENGIRLSSNVSQTCETLDSMSESRSFNDEGLDEDDCRTLVSYLSLSIIANEVYIIFPNILHPTITALISRRMKCKTLDYKFSYFAIRRCQVSNLYQTKRFFDQESMKINEEIDSLTNCIAHFELLAISTQKDTNPSNMNENLEMKNKMGARFMYNYARICQILAEFNRRHRSEGFKILTDYDSLSDEVKSKVYDHFGTVINILIECTTCMSTLSIPKSLPKIFSLMTKFCSEFSRYYRSNQILTECCDIDDLQPVMHCKIHILALMKRFLTLFFNFIDVLPLTSM